MTLAAAELNREMPLKRQFTNERIDFTVLRPRRAGDLTLTLTDAVVR
jgi:hypothetical protein